MPKHVATGELGARQRIAAMAVTTTVRRPLPWFELRQWRVGDVEEVMAELWVRVIERWCYGGGAWARWRHDGDVAAVLLRSREAHGREWKRERERARGWVESRGLSLLARQGGPAPVDCRHAALAALAWSSTIAGDLNWQGPIQFGWQSIFKPPNLPNHGESVKTSLIQSVELHE